MSYPELMSSLPDHIIGHQRQCAELLRDIASRNVSHAYLFSGLRHLGKFTVARWFALQLLRNHLSPESGAAVQDQIERLIHPDFLCLDLLWIESNQEDWNVIGRYSNVPQHHRTKKDDGGPAKSDTIGIKDVHALIEKLYVTGDNPYRCCLIRSIERMSPPAMGALLKALEEPPERVVFLLTTQEKQDLFPTIVSRTRVLQFSPIPEGELRKAFNATNDETTFAIHLSQGAPGKVIQLLENPDLLRENRQLHAQARRFWETTSIKEKFTWLVGLVAERKEEADVLLHLGLTLREERDPRKKAAWTKEFSRLRDALQSNAKKELLYERFAMAVNG